MNATKIFERLPPQSAGERAILDAAVALFSESGYDGVSMRNVAAAAGVSKANIYHHFESKEKLYLTILHISAAELSALVENLANNSENFEQRLIDFSHAYLEHLFDREITVRLMLREAFSRDEKRSKLFADQVAGQVFKKLKSIFHAGQEAGVLRSDLDPGLCATLLMGANIFCFQAQSLLKHLPDTGFATNRDRYSKEMTDVILNGMLIKQDAIG